MFGKRPILAFVIAAVQALVLLNLKGVGKMRNEESPTVPFNTTDTSIAANQAEEEITPYAGGDGDRDFCSTTAGSMNQIALLMTNRSSPPGSASYNKTLLVLQSAPRFFINLNSAIFVTVEQNLATMLKGFGLEQHPNKTVDPNDGKGDVIIVENSHSRVHFRKPNGCIGESICESMPRIIIQSEQLESMKRSYIRYLRACHQSPKCVIWDFSHLQYAQKKGIADSFMLFPIMHQTRFPPFQNRKSMAKRDLDVVFFARMTPRRIPIQAQVAKMNRTTIFEFTRNDTYMKESYANAKICLVAHSYGAESAGEFHRIFELAASGCIPVVETFSDTFAIDTYQQCGGLILAQYDDLVPVIEKTLMGINNMSKTDDSLEARAQWWEKGIIWRDLLTLKYGGEGTVRLDSRLMMQTGCYNPSGCSC